MARKKLPADLHVNLQQRDEGRRNTKAKQNEDRRGESGSESGWKVISEADAHQCHRGEIASLEKAPRLEILEDSTAEENKAEKDHREDHNSSLSPRVDCGAHGHPHIHDEPAEVRQDVAHHRDAHQAEEYCKELAVGRARMKIPVAQSSNESDDKEDGSWKSPFLPVLHLVAVPVEELLQQLVELLLLLAELHVLHPILLAGLHLVELPHLPVEELVPLIMFQFSFPLQPRKNSTSYEEQQDERSDAPSNVAGFRSLLSRHCGELVSNEKVGLSGDSRSPTSTTELH